MTGVPINQHADGGVDIAARTAEKVTLEDLCRTIPRYGPIHEAVDEANPAVAKKPTIVVFLLRQHIRRDIRAFVWIADGLFQPAQYNIGAARDRM